MDALRPLWDAERPRLHSHAERGNDQLGGNPLIAKLLSAKSRSTHFPNPSKPALPPLAQLLL